MGFKKYIWLILPVILFLSGCVNDGPHGEGVGKEYVNVKFTYRSQSLGTRAYDPREYNISNLSVLVFENGYYSYSASAANLTGEDGKYSFSVKFQRCDQQVDVLFVANAAVSVENAGINGGTSFTETKDILAGQFNPSDIYTDIPMYGEHTFSKIDPTDTGNSTVELQMLRSWGAIELRLGSELEDSGRFTLHSIAAYRVNGSYMVVPEAVTRVDGKIKVTEPSLSAVSPGTITTNTKLSVSGYELTGFYLPESTGYEDPADKVSSATCLVIGGYYENSNTPTYYRIDIKDKEGKNTGQVLRNHKYIITIRSVETVGTTDPGEAANNVSMDISTEIIDWNLDTDGNIIIDPNGKYFGLNSSEVTVNYFAGAEKQVEVQTDFEDYRIYWCDANGNILSDQYACPGSGTLNGDIFSISVSDQGSVIELGAITTNDTGGYLVGHALVRAGNIRFVMTLKQRYRTYYAGKLVNIFNMTGERGDLGDQVMNYNFTATGGLSVLSDMFSARQHFGPDGTVPFAGFAISGLPLNFGITAPLADLFDIILIPNITNRDYVNDQMSAILTQWMEQPNRVLITYNSNRTLLEKLGRTAFELPYPGYSFSYIVPEKTPKEILKGPFGTVTPGLQAPVTTTSGIYVIDHAANPDLYPILVNGTNENHLVISADLKRRIIYVADPYLFMPGTPFTGGGAVSKPSDIFLANILTWIAELVVGEELAPDVD